MSYPIFSKKLGISIEAPDSYDVDLQQFLQKYTASPTRKEFEKLRNMPQHNSNFSVNQKWLAARSHVITGSKVSGFVGMAYGSKNREKNKQNFIKKEIWPEKRFINCIYTWHGTIHEECAELALYDILNHQVESGSIKSFEIDNPGLILGNQRCFGYSADGVLKIEMPNGEIETHLCEYKCPYSKRNQDHFDDSPMYGPLTYPLEHGNGESGSANITKYYYCQIQYGMGLLKERGILQASNLSCYFVTWTFGHVYCKRIPFDEGFYRWMKNEAYDTYVNVYAPSVIKKKHHVLQYGEIHQHIST